MNNKIQDSYKLYGGKVELLFDPEKHVYTIDGRKIENATGVTNIINKPMLIPWAVKMATTYLAEVLKAGVAYDEIQIKKMLETAKTAHTVKSGDAADIGTLVHEAIKEFIVTGKPVAPVHAQAKECFENFLKWAKDEKVKFHDSERKVYSKKYDYAGTLDFTCTIGKKFYVGDTKTSTGIYDEYWFQVSGYQQAYVEETKAKVNGQIIVRVGKDGSFELQKRDNKAYKENVKAFNGALVLSRRVNALKAEYYQNSKKGGDLNG